MTDVKDDAQMTESEERVDDDSVDKVVEEKVEDKVDEPVTPHKAASEVSPATPVTPVTPISPTRSKRKAVPSIDSVSVYESSPGASSLQLSEVPPLREAAEIEDSSSSPSRRPRPPAVKTGIDSSDRALSPSQRHAPDSPTTSLINSLRQQLELVSEQAQQLNTKLVASISKHADLEDQIFSLQHEKELTGAQVADLERAKAQWEESMNTGLLVERDQITAEMQRLAAGLVEEERKRGTAEEQRAQVESEIDELAAQLFGQANTMVATERMSRAQAEERLKESEDNLAAAEAAVRDMQQHMQSLTVEAPSTAARAPLPRRYLSSHPPYADFISFVQHLRAARPRTARSRELYAVPAVINLLAQPFLARCIVEDHEPSLRLDAAPDLGWVSRRAVGSAVMSGDLLIEPISAAALGPPETVTCALCGRNVLGHGHAQNSASRFSLNKIFSSPTTGSTNTAPSHTTVFVFRVTGEEKVYPLCKNGWCLERLRAACALWHFIRTGIILPVWNSEDGVGHSRQASGVTPTAITEESHVVHNLAAPPPPKRSASAGTATNTSPAQPEPRRKSAWGIGTWTSWSRPTTPSDKRGSSATPEATTPVTPSEDELRNSKRATGLDEELEETQAELKPAAASRIVSSPLSRSATAPEEIVDEKADDVVVKEEDAAVTEKDIDAESPESKESSEVTEVDISAEGTNDTEDNAANDKLSPPGRPESRASHSGSDASFATPEATPALAATDLSSSVQSDNLEKKDDETTEELEDGKVHEESDKQDQKSDESQGTKTDDTAVTTTDDDANEITPPSVSKEAETTNGTTEKNSPAPPVRPPARSAARAPPPPLPKRAAARSRVPSPSPPTTPTQATSTEVAKSATDDKETEGLVTEDNADESTEEKKDKEEREVTEEKEQIDEKEQKEEAKEKLPEVDEDVAKDDTGVQAENGVEEKAATAETATPDESTVTEPSTPEAVTPTAGAATPTRQTHAVPPPLPPRSTPTSPSNPHSVGLGHPPRTPVSASSASGPRSAHDDELPEKKFATGDAWEVRAWRQVVKLKEDIWRARVGVVDEN